MSTLKVSPDWDLPTLNTFIAQQENFLRGPLVGLRTDGDATILEIDDMATDKPQKNTVLTVSAPPPGATVTGSGQIYLGGTRVDAIAYRPA
jgi:hypothetical protein